MKVMITGHRPRRLRGQEKEIKEWVAAMLDKYSPDQFITGMAQGADQLGAAAAKEKGISILGVYPYDREMHEYEEYLLLNQTRVCLHERYIGKTAYYERDCYMVDAADVVLAVWDGIEKGGTWNTIEYARKQGKEIIYYMVDKDE